MHTAIQPLVSTIAELKIQVDALQTSPEYKKSKRANKAELQLVKSWSELKEFDEQLEDPDFLEELAENFSNTGVKEVAALFRAMVRKICDPKLLRVTTSWAGRSDGKKGSWKSLNNLRNLFFTVLDKRGVERDEILYHNAVHTVLRNSIESEGGQKKKKSKIEAH